MVFANSEKEKMIHAIWKSGFQVGKKIVKWLYSEDLAYTFEKMEIGRIGLDNLTNLCKGGESESTKAIARGKQFIKNLEARLDVYNPDMRLSALGLIAEMRENLTIIANYKSRQRNDRSKPKTTGAC